MNQSIAVIGLGFVGLPLALTFVGKGHKVTGIDLDQRKLASIRQGHSYLPDVPDEKLRSALEPGRFTVTSDYSAISDVNIIVICVPTPLTADHLPDLSCLQKTGTALCDHIRKDQLIILESSTYPGYTKEVWKPMLEREGFTVGQNIFLAYSPERIEPGNLEYPLESIPKVIGGITGRCAQKINDFYSTVFLKVVMVSSTDAAELTKLLENSYRFVNISFINEFAMICDAMNISVWEVIEAARSKPYGFSAFYPGPGAGGHCIPVDPVYLQWKAMQYGICSKFIESSLSVNLNMPRYVIDRIKQSLPVAAFNNEHIFFVGIAYKKNISDTRESSVLDMMKQLMMEGAFVSYHDPYVPEIIMNGMTMRSMELNEQNLKNADCVVIATDHSRLSLQWIVDCATMVYDTRNATGGLHGNARIIRLGEGGIQG